MRLTPALLHSYLASGEGHRGILLSWPSRSVQVWTLDPSQANETQLRDFGGWKSWENVLSIPWGCWANRRCKPRAAGRHTAAPWKVATWEQRQRGSEFRDGQKRFYLTTWVNSCGHLGLKPSHSRHLKREPLATEKGLAVPRSSIIPWKGVSWTSRNLAWLYGRWHMNWLKGHLSDAMCLSCPWISSGPSGHRGSWEVLCLGLCRMTLCAGHLPHLLLDPLSCLGLPSSSSIIWLLQIVVSKPP